MKSSWVVAIVLVLSFAFGLTALIVGEQQKSKGGETVYGSDGTSAHVSLVKLEDGTRCAVVVGMYKGGISCDWK